MSSQRLCTTDLAKGAGLPVHRFPVTEEEAARAEDALAKALNELSLEQRERIIFDVHGIATTPCESEDNIASSLQALEKEIAKISKKDAYNQAVFLNEKYVHCPKFQLMFLRALEFDFEAAAEMIVKHFEVKQELFGNGEILARDVRQSDLNPRDMDLLERGIFQILPTTDASGRAVVCVTSDFGDARMKDLSRANFYFSMVLLKDEDVQRNGTVWVAYNMNNRYIDFLEYAECNRVDASLPCRSAGGHFCSGSHALRPFVSGFQLFFNAFDRFRMRSHFGTLDSIHFNLQTYGIPTQDSPMKPDGTWSTEFHLEWLRTQRLLEEAEMAEKEGNEVIVIPRKYDVLFGKSARARLSIGTQRALHYVDMYREEYEKASKYEKTEIAERIMTQINEAKGRFLKQDESKGGWVVVDDVVARQKIAHWFRHMRWKSSKGQGADQSDVEPVTSSSNNKCKDGRDVFSSTCTRPSKRVAPFASPLLTSEADLTMSPKSTLSSSAHGLPRVVSSTATSVFTGSPENLSACEPTPLLTPTWSF